ncbi:peptide chain release factor 3 [Corynebacterium frankenforstense DSM 45800]|uniref:Peptide chain release factor 3 n=1 Tax=Corynebacterium frankenforstense DSM 45800 TaxID=1437875 RepID=A0A1L7CRV2_9CORY|nr:peptide chain release factor 3 [Corynebacterium frankenforstense]APT88549.1 peptide chain release factor 3 [Corynebacterium frankenforstense DSM 45800]
MTDTAAQASRRRTFAVIAHPDAGKSTLTEALALHAHMIAEAGAVHGKAGRKSTVSDWMDMEKDRGISIASSALQFEYAPEGDAAAAENPYVINLVDTPGHADFSEDTYRVLMAVDAAVMLIDAAKGLEPQTLQLFRVCKARGLPIVTVINKWDRPGREPLELVDEIVTEIGLQPTPLYWPVGEAGDFRGLARVSADGEVDEYVHFLRTAGGAHISPEEHYSPDAALEREDGAWERAVEEAELLAADGAVHDQDLFEACETSPLIFASAMLNFGVHQILDTLCALAPAPSARESDPAAVEAATSAMDSEREVDDEFSGVVFKVQAGMDRRHRDTLAFMRVVSGEFDRGMQVTHAQSGRSFSTKYALTVFGRTRETVETAYPGDIVGLVNAGALAPGDTIYSGRAVQYPPMPQFAPEHFRTLRAKSLGKYKQFRKALEQLDAEGVVQILRNDARGEAAPVMAAVGPMQFEVMQARMENEYNVETVTDPIPYSVARRTDAGSVEGLNRQRGVECFTRTDGELIALFGDKWKLAFIEREHPEFTLEPLVAD